MGTMSRGLEVQDTSSKVLLHLEGKRDRNGIQQAGPNIQRGGGGSHC